jgi:hypothetical protein
VSVAVAATIALGATGCEFMSPAHTVDIKQITDGVDVSTGKVDVRNALLISDDGESARFIGTLVNNDDQDDYTVSIEIGGDTQTVDVPANTHVDLAMAAGAGTDDESSVQEGDVTQGTTAGDAEPIVFDNADATPGSLVKVYFSYPDAEGVSANVPVLTSAQEEYQTLAPSPTPTPTSTSPSESGAQSTGEAVPGTQPSDSQTDSSEGDNGTN